MSVSITHEEGSVIFTNSNNARLYFFPSKVGPSDIGILSTEGTWYVSKHGVDEFIAVLTSIRQMFDDKS